MTEQATSDDAALREQAPPRRRWLAGTLPNLLALALAAVLCAVIATNWNRLISSRTWQRTTDAQLQSDLVPLSALVAKDKAAQKEIELVSSGCIPIVFLHDTLALVEKVLGDDRLMLADFCEASPVHRAVVEMALHHLEHLAHGDSLAHAADKPFLVQEVANLDQRIVPGAVELECFGNEWRSRRVGGNDSYLVVIGQA